MGYVYICTFTLLTIFLVSLESCERGYTGGYRVGQIDALESRWLYQRVEAMDGTVKYIQLDKPTTRRAEQ